MTTKIDAIILITKLRRLSWKLQCNAKRKILNKNKNKNNKRQELCYEYKQLSYFVREHTTRNNIQRRKFNVLLKIIFNNQKY